MMHRPLLTFVFAMVCGMLLSLVWTAGPILFLALAFTGIAALALFKHPLIFPVAIVLIGLSAGGLRAGWYAIVPSSDISHFTRGELDRGPFVTVSGSVASEPDLAHGRETFYLTADRILVSGQTYRVTGEVYASIPEPDAPVGYGDHLQITGFLARPRRATNYGGFDWADYLAKRGVRCQMSAKWPGAVRRDSSGATGPLRWANAIRAAVDVKSRNALPSAQASVLSGILVGASNAIPGDLRADFVHTGTAHILASAGLHVGVLLICILGVLKAIGAPRKAGAAVGIAALLLFMFAAGGRPAVVRACIVGIVWLTGKLLEREPDFLTSLGVAAGIILWMQPTAVLEPGFQLSFATVGVLCAAMPVWKRVTKDRFGVTKLKGNKRTAASWVVDLIGLSIFAQLGSMAIVAANFNEVSVCGVFANIAVVPLVFLIIPIGFSAVATPGVVSHCLFKLAGMLVAWVDAIVRFFSDVPLSYAAVTSPTLLLIVAYYTILLAAIWWFDKKTTLAHAVMLEKRSRTLKESGSL